MTELIIQNFKNSRITLLINEEKVLLRPLEKRTVMVSSPQKLSIRHWSLPISKLYCIDRQTEDMKLQINILRYHFSQPVLIKIFWLLLTMVFAILKAKENTYLIFFFLLLGIALILHTVHFYDILKLNQS